MRSKLFLFLTVLALAASPAFAQSPPFSLNRLSFGVGVDKQVATDGQFSDGEWKGVLAFGYSVIGPSAAKPDRRPVGITVRCAVPFDEVRQPDLEVGIRVTLKRAK